MIDLPKLITPPESFTVTTGGEEERYIIERRDKFFDEVRRSLGVAAMRCDVFFKTYSYQQNYSDTHPTDDRLHLLTYDGQQPIANVLDWRNSFNSHMVVFNVYPLLEYSQQSLERLAHETAQLEQKGTNAGWKNDTGE